MSIRDSHCQQVVGGLDSTSGIEVESHLEILEPPCPLRRYVGAPRDVTATGTDCEPWRIDMALAGITDGIARECLCRFETGGIEGELRAIEIGGVEHELRDLGFP